MKEKRLSPSLHRLLPKEGTMARLLIAFVAMLASVQMAWAQGNYDYTIPEDWSQACITDIGVVVSDVELYLREDLQTHKVDTMVLFAEPEIIWRSENTNVYDSISVDHAMKPRRNVRKKVLQDDGRYQWGNLDSGKFIDFHYYVYRYEYPSVDADGNTVMLSAIAACPTPNGASKVNNIIIGTHVTITSDNQRPSAQINNFGRDDWGMLMSLAAGPKFILNDKAQAVLIGAQAATGIAGVACLLIPGVGLFLSAVAITANIITDIYAIDQMNKAWGYHDYNNNLVILPDYEGYGLTKDRAHPYLYQELTARQCIDATRHGRYLYEHDALLNYLRHPIRSDFRCISMGYSQGGSVAMACHRFVEQNNLVKELHFVGSACGDGPYDPMATLMYYIKNDFDNKLLSMPVVLPLIIKGMLDTNPYMKDHKAEDYFTEHFLSTGIMDWLNDKQLSTDAIGMKFAELYDAGTHSDIFTKVKVKITLDGKEKEVEVGRAKLRDIMNEKCFAYFKKIYEDNKDTFTSAAGIPLPQQRGVYEDLHLALASNDMTSGWNPSHTIKLFHSKGDTVVPYVNAQRAKNALGSKVSLEDAPNKLDHVDSGLDFFRGDSDVLDVALSRILSTRMNEYVNVLCDKKW